MSLNRASKTTADSVSSPRHKLSDNNMERQFDPEHISALNDKYRPLSLEQRVSELYRDFEPAKVMLTSSFAATSAFLLHIFSRYAPDQPVFFIDTGFHFPQTLEYKQKLIALYGIKVVDIRAEDWKHHSTFKQQT